MSIGQTITTGYTPIIPVAGQVQWDGPLSSLLQALLDTVQARVAASGMDIQGTLTLNGNELADVLDVKFSVNGHDPGVAGSVFISGSSPEWYLRDGANNRIQLTAGGFLNVQGSGSIGGDYPNSSASALYLNSIASFRFYSSPGVYSTMENGTVRIHNGNSAGYIGLQAPQFLASNVNYTFPGFLPEARQVLQVSTSGTMDYTFTPLLSGSVAAGGTYYLTGNQETTGNTRIFGNMLVSGNLAHTNRTTYLNLMSGHSASNITNFYAATGSQPGWYMPFSNSSAVWQVDCQVAERIKSVDVYFYSGNGGVAGQVTASLYLNPRNGVGQIVKATANALPSPGFYTSLSLGAMPNELVTESGHYTVNWTAGTNGGGMTIYGIKLIFDCPES